MESTIRTWWNDGQAEAVAVYPARLLIPLTALTIVVLILYFTLPDSRQKYWFFLAFWIACAVPLFVRRRRAAVFTADTFLYRPVFGRPLKVPFAGIKRAYSFSKGQTEEGGGFVRLELLVGGQIDVRLNVRKPEEIIRRLQEAAKQVHSSVDSPTI